MALKIEMSPESVRPVVVCDGCGELIADARDGNYQWQAPVDPGLSQPLVLVDHLGSQAHRNATAALPVDQLEVARHRRSELLGVENLDDDDVPAP